MFISTNRCCTSGSNTSSCLLIIRYVIQQWWIRLHLWNNEVSGLETSFYLKNVSMSAKKANRQMLAVNPFLLTQVSKSPPFTNGSLVKHNCNLHVYTWLCILYVNFNRRCRRKLEIPIACSDKINGIFLVTAISNINSLDG